MTQTVHTFDASPMVSAKWFENTLKKEILTVHERKTSQCAIENCFGNLVKTMVSNNMRLKSVSRSLLTVLVLALCVEITDSFRPNVKN